MSKGVSIFSPQVSLAIVNLAAGLALAVFMNHYIRVFHILLALSGTTRIGYHFWWQVLRRIGELAPCVWYPNSRFAAIHIEKSRNLAIF